jgi:hypothetical protein
VDIGTATNGSNSEPKTGTLIRDVRMICKRGGFRAALGSGLIDHSQKMTAAAMQIAEK